MFDDLFRELKRLEQPVSIPVNMPLDDDGHFDRLCPWEACHFTFKVLWDDLRDKVPDELAYCPSCRHENSRSAFNTPEQIEYLAQVGAAYLSRRVQQAMRSSAAQWNQRPQRGLVAIKLNAKSVPIPEAAAPAAREAMTIRISCEQCDCHFAVIGAAYFCPSCGHNSAGQTFDQAIEATRRTIRALPGILEALPDRDTAAQLRSKLVEGQLVSLVMAFQRFAQAEYPRLANPLPSPGGNAFQSLQKGSPDLARAPGTHVCSVGWKPPTLGADSAEG
jgi:hypothetical protein